MVHLCLTPKGNEAQSPTWYSSDLSSWWTLRLWNARFAGEMEIALLLIFGTKPQRPTSPTRRETLSRRCPKHVMRKPSNPRVKKSFGTCFAKLSAVNATPMIALTRWVVWPEMSWRTRWKHMVYLQAAAWVLLGGFCKPCSGPIGMNNALWFLPVRTTFGRLSMSPLGQRHSRTITRLRAKWSRHWHGCLTMWAQTKLGPKWKRHLRHTMISLMLWTIWFQFRVISSKCKSLHMDQLAITWLRDGEKVFWIMWATAFMADVAWVAFNANQFTSHFLLYPWAKLQSTTLPNQSPLFHLGFVRLFGEENSTQARANTRWNGGELTKPTSHVFLVKWRSFTNTGMACDSQDSPRSPKIHQANKNAYGFLYVPCTWLPGSTNLFQHDIYHPQKGYKSTTLPFFCYGNWPFPSCNKDCNINLLAVSAHLAKAQIASRLQAGMWLWASLRNWRQALFGAIRKP